MDYARKIGKSDEPKKWVKQPPALLRICDGLISPQSNFTEDSRLVNWRQWLQRRKAQYEHTKSVTGRQQVDQVVNSCEKVREQVEMRNLMEYANVPVPVIPDKYRGGPEFWRTPEKLYKGDAACPCLPDITFVPTKKDLNVIPEFTYVDLPALTEKEKDLASMKSKEPLWKRSQYLMRRRQELSREIELLMPKEPEMRELAIKNFVVQKPKQLPRIPPITVTRVGEGEEEENTEEVLEKDPCCECYPENIVVLRIQDRDIVWDKSATASDQSSEPIMWSLTFSGKVNKRTELEIRFKNKGDRVVIYEWRPKVYHSNVLPIGYRTSPFYFKKTTGVLLPGQIVKLKIWYRPRNAHVATEYWRLITDPVLCSSPLIFRFWGCAETEDPQMLQSDPIQMVDGYLDRCVRDTVVLEIVNEILDNIESFKHPEPAYGNLFLEEEQFVLKNPLCHYNPSLLIEFHKLYYNATNQRERRWNMLLTDLREVLLKMKQSELRSELLLQFGRLYKESLKPTLYNPIRSNKYEVVYYLLCSFFNLFEIESEMAKNACFLRETKKISDTVSETSQSLTLDMSIEDDTPRKKESKKSSMLLKTQEIQKPSEISICIPTDRPYKEIFFIRMYQLLGETIVRVFASIESFNNLNERDK
ncbi:MYCBP-associated protein-like [Ceratina calcarata]|uniref:MYCBP-associated protein-like n=1 Tax=Ceratina calcarata TaxID=156304 RepID=A0AAJ7N8F6_9HYME|nr:MYCBP-associated protein-like [Ceratina calcarata]